MTSIIIFGLAVAGALLIRARFRRWVQESPEVRAQRMQQALERLQAQAGAPPPEGQFTRPAAGQGVPPQLVPGQVLPTVPPPNRYPQLGQFQPAPTPAVPYQAPPAAPYQAPPAGPYQAPPAAPFQALPAGPYPAPFPPPGAQRAVPVKPSPSQRDVEQRVRDLMAAGHEVGAVRLLCDELDLGIIDAQKRARAIADGASGRQAGTNSGARPQRSSTGQGDPTWGSPREGSTGQSGAVGTGPARGGTAANGSGYDRAAADDEPRYVGSAAFAESIFDLHDDDSWPSGWTERPEPDDRSDIDELWQTVRSQGRPPEQQVTSRAE